MYFRKLFGGRKKKFGRVCPSLFGYGPELNNLKLFEEWGKTAFAQRNDRIRIRIKLMHFELSLWNRLRQDPRLKVTAF